MPRPANFFTHLAGVAVHYDRFPDPAFSYGTRGKPLNFHATDPFEQKLNACFEELWDVCGLGEAQVITSAGTFVDKPGAHGLGRAFDLDGIFWANRTFVTLRYPQDRRFYLGVDAVLRKHFGTVLNYEYNAAHQDHLHVEDLSATGFVAQHRSRVLFLQMALTFLFSRPVAIDGRIGSETDGASRDLLLDLGLSTPDAVAGSASLHDELDRVWFDLLDLAAEIAFSDTTPEPASEPTPLALIEHVYGVIEHELGGLAARKRIETALTAFVNHEETTEWLDGFRDGG